MVDDITYRIYNALDALATLHASDTILLDMEEARVADFYWRIPHPLSQIVGKMNRIGVWADQSKREVASADLKLGIAEKERELNELAGREINASGDSLREWLYDDLKLPRLIRKKSEKPSTDKHVLKTLATRYPELETVFDLVISIRNLKKLDSTYVEVSSEVDEFGRVHPAFRIGPVTGRLACVAKDTLVSLVNRGVEIQHVKPGDLVYGYDEDDSKRLVVKPIKNVWSNGLKNVVRVHWQRRGNRQHGHIDLTSDHLVKLFDGTYKQAGHLEPGDRILWAQRSQRGHYSYMWSKEGVAKECHIVARSFHNYVYGSGDHVHHKNGDKLDDSPSNLEVLSSEDHTSLHGQNISKELRQKRSENAKRRWDAGFGPIVHSSGRYHPCYQEWTKWQLLRLLSKTRGRLSKVTEFGHDKTTIREKCKANGINLSNVKMRYGFDGQYLSRGLITTMWRSDQTHREKARTIRSSEDKLDQLYAFYGLGLNHCVTFVEKLTEPTEVYDIEVDGISNFIANEVSVHNCKRPPFQGYPKGLSRSIYAAPPGRVFVGADYKQVELRIFAILGQCRALLEAFARGEDPHDANARTIYDIPPGIKVESVFRKCAKNYVFGMIYGGSVPTLTRAVSAAYEQSGKKVDPLLIARAMQRFFDANPEAEKFMNAYKEQVLRTRAVYNNFGRLRLFFGPKKDILGQAMNYPIQSGAGDLVNERMIILDRELPWAQLLLQVHDFVLYECDEDDAERTRDKVKEVLEAPCAEFGGYSFPVDIQIGKNWAEV